MAELGAPVVDETNTEQARAWDGDEGAFWAEHADQFDDGVAAYRQALLDAAALAPTDDVLDVGCGTGQTTRDAARAAPAGTALGIDLSARMLEVARRRAEEEGFANARFVQGDAQVHPFDPGAFDVVVSRTGASFFGDPVAAFANLRRALRPGGRLAVLTWQPPAANEWINELLGAVAAGRDLAPPPAGVQGPFGLADPDGARAVLDGAGFHGVDLAPVSAPMRFGAGVEDAYDFLTGFFTWLLAPLDDAGRTRATEQLRASLTAHAGPDGVSYGSAMWLLTATAP